MSCLEKVKLRVKEEDPSDVDLKAARFVKPNWSKGLKGRLLQNPKETSLMI